MELTQGLERLRQEREAIAALESNRTLREGQLSPRARVNALLDAGTFVELGALGRSQMSDAPETATDGIIAGFGAVAGRMIAVIADDALVQARTDGAIAENKRMKLLAQALHGKMPIVYLADGAPAGETSRPPEEGALLGYYSDRTMVAASLDFSTRESPVVSVVLGAIPLRQAAFVAESDFVVRSESIGSDIPADSQAGNDGDAVALVRDFLVRMPPRLGEELMRFIDGESPAPAAPLHDANAAGLPLRGIVDGLFDPAPIEFNAAVTDGAGEFCAGLGMIDGYPVLYAGAGPAARQGSDAAASEGAQRSQLSRAALDSILRIAALSRRFQIPLLLLQNGAALDESQLRQHDYCAQLARGIALIRDSASIKFSLITRAGHALDDFILGGRELGTHYLAAWPWADVGIRPLPAYTTDAAKSQQGAGPWDAAGYGLIDDVITPAETRARLIYMLELLAPSRALPPESADRGGRILTR